MVEDRESTRPPEFREPRWQGGLRLRWSWTLTLVAVYLAVLVAKEMTVRFFPQHSLIFHYLALSREGLAHGYVWQLVTYQFMHAGWLHLILNSWAILVFGSEVEHLLGGRRYLGLIFLSGIVGGVFQVATAMVWPSVFDGSVVGASACAFGLVAAFATIFPERELTLLILFIIPARLRARTLLMVSVLLAGLGIFFPWDNVANAAHLGGILTGWLIMKRILRNHRLPAFATEDVPLSSPASMVLGEARVEPVKPAAP